MDIKLTLCQFQLIFCSILGLFYMSLNSNEIFSRLLLLFKTKKMNELSILLGYKESWGAATRKRGGIPFEACVIASEKFNVSMDSLLFDTKADRKEIDINELKLSVTEGIFSAIQTELITLNKDVKISHITEVITSEIKEVCNIIDENKQLKKVQ